MVIEDGYPVASIPPAHIRAKLVRAHRVHEARLIAGHDDEEPLEAQAGAILEAQTAINIHRLTAIAEAWLEANTKKG